jgi:hypothetical protein
VSATPRDDIGIYDDIKRLEHDNAVLQAETGKLREALKAIHVLSRDTNDCILDMDVVATLAEKALAEEK